jgi:hypothetical protein
VNTFKVGGALRFCGKRPGPWRPGAGSVGKEGPVMGVGTWDEQAPKPAGRRERGVTGGLASPSPPQGKEKMWGDWFGRDEVGEKTVVYLTQTRSNLTLRVQCETSLYDS